MRACCIINVLLCLSRLQSQLGCSQMPLRNAATTPTSTQLCGVKFPFDIFPGICFLCWKTSSLRRRESLVHDASFCFVYSTVMAPYKSCLRMWQRIYTHGTGFFFFTISLRHLKGSSSIPIKAESNQSVSYQQHQMLLRVFFELEALMASLGLISWSASLCKQQTVFMFAVT